MIYQRLFNTLNTALADSRRMLIEVTDKLNKYDNYKGVNIQRKENRGHTEYYRAIYDGSKRSLNYIKKSDYSIVHGAANYRFFKCLKDWLVENIKMLERQICRLNSFDMNSVFKALPQTYQIHTDEISHFYDEQYIKDWLSYHEEQKLKYPAPYPEHLTQPVHDDIFVRTKGEMIIYLLLEKLGLPFVYEAPYFSSNGVIYHPDFTVLNPWTHKVLLIEHDGSFAKPDKRGRTIEKIQVYFDDGLRPYQDYIFTFDYKNGTIDAERIRELIELCV